MSKDIKKKKNICDMTRRHKTMRVNTEFRKTKRCNINRDTIEKQSRTNQKAIDPKPAPRTISKVQNKQPTSTNDKNQTSRPHTKTVRSTQRDQHTESTHELNKNEIGLKQAKKKKG